jgi:hypothetical protein
MTIGMNISMPIKMGIAAMLIRNPEITEPPKLLISVTPFVVIKY